MQNVYKTCFVLQIINFHSHNTSLKNKNNRAYLKFVFAEGDVLEQDIELCPFCYFPVTTDRK